jgi:hypothetical protein
MTMQLQAGRGNKLAHPAPVAPKLAPEANDNSAGTEIAPQSENALVPSACPSEIAPKQ